MEKLENGRSVLWGGACYEKLLATHVCNGCLTHELTGATVTAQNQASKESQHSIRQHELHGHS